MNIIKNILPFLSLPIESTGFTINNKLIAGRKQKITGVAVIALGCLNLSLFAVVGGFSATVAPIGLTIFAISLVASLVFVSLIPSKYANWDEQRARSAIITKVSDDLKSKNPCLQSFEWLLNDEEAIGLLKFKIISPEGLKLLFSDAIASKKLKIAAILWAEFSYENKAEFFVKYYDDIILFLDKYELRRIARFVFFECYDCDYFENSETGKKILNFLLTDIDDNIDLFCNGRSQKDMTESEIEKINLLWNKTNIDDDYNDIHKLILKEFDSPFYLPKFPSKRIAYSALYSAATQGLKFNSKMIDWLLKDLENLPSFLEKLRHTNTSNSNISNIIDKTVDEDNLEAFKLLLRDFRKDDKLLKNFFLRSFNNVDNPKIPGFLIENKMVTASMFTVIEQNDILVKCASPFKVKNVKHLGKSSFGTIINEEQIENLKCKKPEQLLFYNDFPLKSDYIEYKDVWVERLVRFGFDLDAKNSDGISASDSLNDIRLGRTLRSVLNRQTSAYSLSTFANIVCTSKDRFNFFTELRKRIYLEKLPLIHYALTQNLVQDVSESAFKLYDLVLPIPFSKKERQNFVTDYNKKMYLKKRPLVHHFATEIILKDVGPFILNYYDRLLPNPCDTSDVLDVTGEK